MVDSSFALVDEGAETIEARTTEKMRSAKWQGVQFNESTENAASEQNAQNGRDCRA